MENENSQMVQPFEVGLAVKHERVLKVLPLLMRARSRQTSEAVPGDILMYRSESARDGLFPLSKTEQALNRATCFGLWTAQSLSRLAHCLIMPKVSDGFPGEAFQRDTLI